MITYKSYQLKTWAGILDVWCSIYQEGRRIADVVAPDKAQAVEKAKETIDSDRHLSKGESCIGP